MQKFACRGTHVIGLPTRELARVAGVSAAAIRMRRWRARQRLLGSVNPAIRSLARSLTLTRRRRPTHSLLSTDA